MNSTNWNFESIDKQLGASTINSYLQQIGYGNENISGDFSSYWMQSSLKISPVEQVELLKNLYRNNFNFTPANVHAVKNSIHLTASENGEFYGKTGTRRVNGQDINGWFIGFIESQNNTYFFSTNIQSEQRATGSKASDGALSTRIDSSHKYKHLPTLQELTYTPILAVFQKSLLTAIPPQHTVLM